MIGTHLQRGYVRVAWRWGVNRHKSLANLKWLEVKHHPHKPKSKIQKRQKNSTGRAWSGSGGRAQGWSGTSSRPRLEAPGLYGLRISNHWRCTTISKSIPLSKRREAVSEEISLEVGICRNRTSPNISHKQNPNNHKPSTFPKKTHLGDQAVEVRVGGLLNVQEGPTDVVEGLIFRFHFLGLGFYLGVRVSLARLKELCPPCEPR